MPLRSTQTIQSSSKCWQKVSSLLCAMDFFIWLAKCPCNSTNYTQPIFRTRHDWYIISMLHLHSLLVVITGCHGNSECYFGHSLVNMLTGNQMLKLFKNLISRVQTTNAITYNLCYFISWGFTCIYKTHQDRVRQTIYETPVRPQQWMVSRD